MKLLRHFIIIFILSSFSQTINAQSDDFDFLMDERDGNIYLIMKFNDHLWMCQNLKFDIGEGSSCYEGEETNCMLKGRWYTYDAAKRACPEGYRLPSDDEWKALESFLGMDKADLDKRYNRNSGTIGTFLKMDGGLGFDAEFAGVVNPNGNDSYFDTQVYLWTSTEINETTAWARVLEDKKVGVDRKMITKNYGLSVRCIKDVEKAEDQE